jgi:hypothetical protein
MCWQCDLSMCIVHVSRSTQSLAEKKTQDTPDDTVTARRRPLSRIEDLIDKRKTNRGLTPEATPTKKRSQS